MDADGQIFFDEESQIPPADRERYLAAMREEKRLTANERMTQLEELFKEVRDGEA